jgi:sugar phosphate isomerase/epimerase
MPGPPPISIQCSTGPLWALELERAFDIVAEAGFTEIEFMVTRDARTQEPDLPVKLATERGLKISSVHGPFLVITKSVWGMDPLGKITRGVEMCKAFGATALIVHPPYLWEGDYARWVRTECKEFCDENGVRVAVETMYPKWMAGRRLRAYRWLEPGALQHAAPYVALDTSHLAVARMDILDALHVLAPKLAHVHLSNNAGDGRDGHLEIENGVLPLDRFIAELRRTKYRGAVSLELTVRRYLQQPEDLVAMLSRNREYVATRLAAPTRVSKGLPRR